MSTFPPPPPPPSPPREPNAHDDSSPFSAPPPWIPPGSPKRSRLGVVGLIAVIVVLALIAGGLYLIIDKINDDGPDYPDEWDPRITELVEYAERARDLEFQHPVDVEFLEEAAFLETLRTETADLDAEARDQRDEADRQAVGYFRALGLLEGDVNLSEESSDLDDAGTLAYYDPETERVVVRGTELDIATEVTVVHELVHVLQDQHFDLEDLSDAADEAFRADPDGIVEGDATRIEREYVDDLSESDQETYFEQYEDLGNPDAFDEVPLILRLIRAAPYETGSQFVEILDADDGNRSVDEAFDNPPRTEEQLFDPSTFDRRALARDVPEFSEENVDDIVYSDDEFGPMGWLLMLGEQIDTRTAMKAALGWGGDRARTVDDDGQICVEMRFVGDSDADEDEMHDALRSWRRALPHGDDIDVRRHDNFVEVRACDPGSDASDITTDRSESAFVRQIQRLSFIEFALTDSDLELDLEQATCMADGIAITLTDDELQADELNPASTRAIGRIRRGCLGDEA